MSVLSAEFPQMKLFLHELQTDVLIERLLGGKLDAAILAKLDWDYPIVEWALYHEPLWLAMSEKDQLASLKSPVSESVLDGRSLLMLEDGHCLRDQAMGVCFAAGANEDDRYQATSMDTLLHMVSSGHGMTIVPELATKKPMEGVIYKQFKEDGPGRDIVLVGRRNSSRTLALEKIAESISRSIA
jgi:LysR family hydrogen peroxide-inducible transcriptional activator